jgi:hypothetical protein
LYNFISPFCNLLKKLSFFKDFLGKSDPYLEFSRQTPDGAWQVVHRTEVRSFMLSDRFRGSAFMNYFLQVIKNDLNPKWKPVVVKAQKLCAGNYESPIKVQYFSLIILFDYFFNFHEG